MTGSNPVLATNNNNNINLIIGDTNMTYLQLNINERINFKSWFSHQLLLSSVKDLAKDNIDTIISATEQNRYSEECWTTWK